MTIVKQALLSVSDKTGIVEFAQALRELGVSILSTGGTAKLLKDSGIPVTEIGDYTGFPEMLDGRVKTLHPKVHAGILARRDSAEHMQALSSAQIPTIDLLVVNLYPFTQTIANKNCSLEEAIENIDIGGPTMIRAAAKNYLHVGVVTQANDYSLIVRELNESNGSLSQETKFNLAKKAFSHTAFYDGAISNYLTSLDDTDNVQRFPQRLNLQFDKVQNLRYGENPHQAAAFYRDLKIIPGALSNYTQLQGKELSYNNIADADAAWECVKQFDTPACVIVKHANPCGVAVAATAAEAYSLAFATDTTSAFGGIIAFNVEVDVRAAEALTKQFVEVLIAPSINNEAASILASKPNIRVLRVSLDTQTNEFDFKRIGGGLLVQTPDSINVSASQLSVVTRLQPKPQQLADLVFAWRVAKFIKSNAIVFCGNGQTLGIGAGQMSRVDSAQIAAIKAQRAGLSLDNSVVASDAFFPFRDGVDVVANAGAKAIVQPGGSMRDEEVIKAADELGVTMVFTGVRHFRH